MPEWVFPISPIAASRPRISKHGAYFAGPYKQFRKDMIDLVPEILGDMEPFEGPLKVDVELYVTRPKKTKLIGPKADIDNYLKSILDSMNNYLWVDDTQIIEIFATKQWTPKNEIGYFTIGVDKL